MSEVKLIAYTQSKEIAGITSQDIMAYCARVSNPSNQNNSETAGKLNIGLFLKCVMLY